MDAKLSAMLCTNKRIEAIYEVDTAGGGFATVVRRSDGREELYPHCKIETVLDTLAACKGKDLSRLRLLRGKKRGNSRSHIDFYEMDLSLILMPVRQRRAVNSNHGVMAYLNVSRICKVTGKEQAVVTFISGDKLQLKESAASVQAKLIMGRELLYENMFVRSEELHYMRYYGSSPCRRTNVFFREEDLGEDQIKVALSFDPVFHKIQIYRIPNEEREELEDLLQYMLREEASRDGYTELLQQVRLKELMLLVARYGESLDSIAEECSI